MKIHKAVKYDWTQDDAGISDPRGYFDQPHCVQSHKPRWWIDTGVACKKLQVTENFDAVVSSGITAYFDDGWNGSYHDCWYYPGSTQTWIVMGFGRKAGILGKMRKLARRIQAEAAPAKADPNTPVRLLARGIWRAEGD